MWVIRAPRDAQATVYLLTVLGALGVGVTALVVPGLSHPGSPFLAAGLAIFAVAGAYVLRVGRISPRAAHPLTVAAILGGFALIVPAQDPLVRCISAAWNLMAPMYMSSSLSRRATGWYSFACVVSATVLVAMTPGPPLAFAVRLVTMAGLVALPLLYLISLRRELDVALDRARDLATSDTLTGLLNRRGLAERFAALARDGRRRHDVLAVVTLDLDHFKTINDTLGHAAGDAVLVAVADSLRSAARSGDLVVRLGGEEIVLVGWVSSTDDAAALGERLREQVRRDAAAWNVTTSVGVAVAAAADLAGEASGGPAGDREPLTSVLDALLGESDACLYAAKAAGRNRVVGPRRSPELERQKSMCSSGTR